MKVKGYELMQMIADGKIKDGTRINIIGNGSNPYRFYTIVGTYRCLRIWREEIGKEDVLLERVLDTNDLLIYNFEILEDKTEEIEEIKELDEWVTYRNGEVTQSEAKTIEIGNKVNELVREINQIKKYKQLDTSKETNCMTD